jgi:hypothetical protein
VITIATDYDGSRWRDVSSIPKANVVEKRYFNVGKVK